MGNNPGAFAPNETLDEQGDIDKVHNAQVRRSALITYLVGAALFVVLWLVVVGIRRTRNHAPMGIGLVTGLLFLAVNAWQSQKETIGVYSVERAEMAQLERNSFSIVAAMFALGSVLTAVRREVVSEVLPLLMITVLFAVVLVMAPVWTSTVDSRETIRHKHIKSVLMVYGLGFMTAAISVVFFHEFHTWSTRKLLFGTDVGSATRSNSSTAPETPVTPIVKGQSVITATGASTAAVAAGAV